MKELLEISSFSTCVPKTTYELQFLRYGVRYNFLSFWAIFCPFTPPNNPENQKFEKIKKASGYDVCLLRYGVQHNFLSF